MRHFVPLLSRYFIPTLQLERFQKRGEDRKNVQMINARKKGIKVMDNSLFDDSNRGDAY